MKILYIYVEARMENDESYSRWCTFAKSSCERTIFDKTKLFQGVTVVKLLCRPHLHHRQWKTVTYVEHLLIAFLKTVHLWKSLGCSRAL